MNKFVLNILNTPKGLQIAEEMKQWLCPVFEVYECLHTAEELERPGIVMAQEISMKTGDPVGYIHTKGAFNNNGLQTQVRNFWKRELTTKDYFNLHPNSVNTPFTGDNKVTWFNMFVADAEAWRNLEILPDNGNRYYYEWIWKDSNATVNGLVLNNVNPNPNGGMSHSMTEMFRKLK